jgi:6-phosphogluconolactonase
MIAYVPCFAQGNAHGLAWFNYDPQAGNMAAVGSTGEGINSPLYVQVDPTKRFLFAADYVPQCDGVEGGAICAFAIDQSSGIPTFINRKPAGGQVPCYISVSRDSRFILVANYASGSVSVLPVNADGSLGDAVATVQHDLSGKDPHAHSFIFSPDQRFAIAADLGIDQILVYRFDSKTGAITPNDPPFTSTADGAGPRHITFHPNGKLLYAMTEYDNTVIAMAWDADTGTASIIHTIASLPPDFTDTSYGADIHIHPSGRFLYVSNRGHESIAAFAIDQTAGTLTLIAHEPTQGQFPRGMTLDPAGNFLLVANEKTDKIIPFAIDQTTGRLTPTGNTTNITSPASVLCVS